MLSRMFWPEFPVPVGVLRSIDRPTHDQLIAGQLDGGRGQAGEGDLAKVLHRRRDLDGRVTLGRRHRRGQEAGGDVMSCPACGFENLQGEDTCDNCGADLWRPRHPAAGDRFQGRLLGEHLDDLRRGRSPSSSGRTTSVDEVVETHASRRAPTACSSSSGDRLVGIFTDRDAVLKAAGTDARARSACGDLMTPDPVVLRHDDPSPWRSTRWPSAASATSRSSRTGIRPASSPPATCSPTSPGRWAEPVTTRVAVLAQDLIWQDRLARAVEAAGADADPGQDRPGARSARSSAPTTRSST